MISRVTTFLIGTAALAAAVLCYNLTIKHISGSSGVGWFEAGCSAELGPGKMDCAKVLESPYSYFPPKHPGKPSRWPHFPAAFLGLLYYSVLLVWIIGVGRPTLSRRIVHALPLLLVGTGLLFSAYFTFIMYRVIALWCPWCLVTHGLNLLIAIGLVVLWPRRNLEKMPDEVDVGPEGSVLATMPTPPHPSLRLVLTTLLAMLFVTYGHVFLVAWRESKKERSHLQTEVDFYRSNVGGFIAQWRLAAPCDLVRRADDPVHAFAPASDSEPVLDVVVFSDFECPSCAKFARFFHDNVPSLFDKRIRLTFHHFPLDQSCNSRAVKTLHPNACSASFLAERVRLSGGNDAFWKAHDYLFEHQNEIKTGQMTAEILATAIGLDALGLRDADSSVVTSRVTWDVDQGRMCKIPGTPAIFVDGRRIETPAAVNLEFWDKLADWYWIEKARQERPNSSKITPPPTSTPPPS